ncbi:MAG: hypothetical protein EBU88_10325 [Acidobacteria bacterium]|nr:hypothetical protein [Acidobacteriota bacterium]
MSDIELNINYLVACIDSINQLKDIPAADELKTIVNEWVDRKVADTVNDPSVALKVYCNWKKLAGESGSDQMAAWLDNMPVAESSNEIATLLHTWVAQRLTAAFNQPESRMMIFRSWLAVSPQNINNTFNIVIDSQQDPEPLSLGGDTGPLNWPKW